MRTTILLLLACGLAGCADHTPPPKLVIVPDAPVVDEVPPEDRPMSPAQITELKNRLAQLKVGMSRANVHDILDISSFKLHTFEIANKTGIVYRIKEGHVLELGMTAGDYDSIFKWAKFDGELWPKAYKMREPAPAPMPAPVKSSPP